MTATSFGAPAITVRRVKITSVNEDATETTVSDSTGWITTLNGSIRPKGTLPPEVNEIWLIERFGTTWLLKAQERAGEPDLPQIDLQAVAAEVERQLAEQAQAEADLRAREAALAAGILEGNATVLIQSATPGAEHQNATTLWIDTTNDRNRPMRWDGTQWVVVVDQIAIEAARRAVTAHQAAQTAAQAAQDAQDAAAAAEAAAQAAQAASEAAIGAVAAVQQELVGVQGKIDGKSTIYPVGSSPTLGPEDVGDMRLLADGGVEYWDGQAWQVADPRVAAAVTDAALALGLTNTKITTYYKAVQPSLADIEPPETAFTVGDLWIRTGDKRLHRWDGESWVEAMDAAITALSSDLADAVSTINDRFVGVEGRIDGKSTIYVQPTAPAEVSGAEHTGDLWIDTHNGGRVYKAWDGDEWVLVNDPEVQRALTLVNAKITTYYGDTAPQGTQTVPLATGDLWFRSPDNRLHRFDGNSWVEVYDRTLADSLASVILDVTALENSRDAQAGLISDLQSDLTTLGGRVDGKATIYYQPSAPTELTDANRGDIWIDSDAVPKTYQSWSGNAWVSVTDATAIEALNKVQTRITTYYQAAKPTGGTYVLGDLWIDTDDRRLYRYNGSDFVEVTYVDPRVAQQATAISTIQGDLTGLSGRVDGKATIHYQPSAPTGLTEADAGDIWIDSDASPKTYQSWSGTQWVNVTDATAIEALSKVATKITTYYRATTSPPSAPAGGFTTGDLWVVTDLDNLLRRWSGGAWVDLKVGADAISATARELGSITTYYGGTTGPSGAIAGDLWLDATNKVHRYDGASWVVLQDQQIATALQEVATAQATADGKIKMYAQPAMPTGLEAGDEGDIWIDTDDGNRMYVWGLEAGIWKWIDRSDVRFAQMSTALSNLQSQYTTLEGKVDGKAVVYYQNTDPRGGTTWGTDQKGDIWIDTTGGQHTYKVWSGTAWTTITDPKAIEALSTVATKVVTYYAASNAAGTAPTGTGHPPPGGYTVGDLWIRLNDNRLHRWDGASWVELKDKAFDDLQAYADDAISRSVNLIDNPSRDGARGRWTEGTIVQRPVEGVTVPVIEVHSTDNNFVYSSDQSTNGGLFRIDPTKAYQVSVWLEDEKALDAPGAEGSTQIYLGVHVYAANGTTPSPLNPVRVSDGAVESSSTNFYFFSATASDAPIGGFRRYVGYLMPMGSDPVRMTGLGINVARNVILGADAAWGRVRVLNYNNQNTPGGRKVWTGHPTVVEVDPLAVEAAARAQLTADGKNRVWSQPEPPTGLTPDDEGDLWIETDNGNKRWVWKSVYHPPETVRTVGAVQDTNWVHDPRMTRMTGKYVSPSTYADQDTTTWAVPGNTIESCISNYFEMSLQSTYIGVWVGAWTGARTFSAYAQASVEGQSGRIVVEEFGDTGVRVQATVGPPATLPMMSGGVRLSVTVPARHPLAVGNARVSVVVDTPNKNGYLYATAFQATDGSTLVDYFDGDTVDTNTDDYAWSSPATPASTPSVRRKVTVTTYPGGNVWEWAPHDVGSGGIEDGAVGDDELAAEIVMATTRFIARADDGTEATMGPTGFDVSIPDDEGGGRRRMVYLGVEGNQTLEMLTPALDENGDPVPGQYLTYGFDSDGNSKATAVFTNEVYVGGRPLRGGTKEDATSMDPNSLTWEDPWGVIARGDLKATAHPNILPPNKIPSGVHQGIGHMEVQLYAGRSYEITLSPCPIDANTITTGNSTWVTSYIFYTSSTTGEPANPVVKESAGPEERIVNRRSMVPNHSTSTQGGIEVGAFSFPYYAEETMRMKLLFALAPRNCTVIIGGAADYGVWRMFVKDMGPFLDNIMVRNTSRAGTPDTTDPTPPPTTNPPSTKTYTSYWHPTSVLQYQGDWQGAGSWNGQSMNGFIGQGWHSAMGDARHALCRFDNALSISGSGQVGVTPRTALNGAKIESIKLRWTNYAGYQAAPGLVGWQSGTGIPSPVVTSAKVSVGAKYTLDLTKQSSLQTLLKATGGTYITFGPGPKSNKTNYFFGYGTNGTAGVKGNRLMLEVKYTRTV